MFAQEAVADSGAVYVSGNAQFVMLNDSDSTASYAPGKAVFEFKPGFGVGVAVGHGFSGGFRAEGELGYKRNELDSVKSGGVKFTIPASESESIDVYTGMLNGYYDFKNFGQVTPYIGAGVGVAKADDLDAAFAYQGMAGVSFAINQKSSINVGYRYLGTSDFKGKDAGDKYTIEYGAHSAEIGYKMNF